jgi:hypothetical protein
MRPDAWAANTWTDSLPMFVGERNLAGARCRRRLSPGGSSWAVCCIHRGRSGAGGPAATRGSRARARACGGKRWNHYAEPLDLAALSDNVAWRRSRHPIPGQFRTAFEWLGRRRVPVLLRELR